jgi:alkylhydroperoxidase/carboxymuconolactone decarboxylase family protein YurZ
LCRLALRIAFIRERPGLSKRDGSLIVVASLISLYCSEQLKGLLLAHSITA